LNASLAVLSESQQKDIKAIQKKINLNNYFYPEEALFPDQRLSFTNGLINDYVDGNMLAALQRKKINSVDNLPGILFHCTKCTG
jgi:hypothetical protein